MGQGEWNIAFEAWTCRTCDLSLGGGKIREVSGTFLVWMNSTWDSWGIFFENRFGTFGFSFKQYPPWIFGEIPSCIGARGSNKLLWEVLLYWIQPDTTGSWEEKTWPLWFFFTDISRHMVIFTDWREAVFFWWDSSCPSNFPELNDWLHFDQASQNVWHCIFFYYIWWRRCRTVWHRHVNHRMFDDLSRNGSLERRDRRSLWSKTLWKSAQTQGATENWGDAGVWQCHCLILFPKVSPWEWKMGAWKMTLVSKGAIFHFHDYGRKCIWNLWNYVSKEIRSSNPLPSLGPLPGGPYLTSWVSRTLADVKENRFTVVVARKRL